MVALLPSRFLCVWAGKFSERAGERGLSVSLLSSLTALLSVRAGIDSRALSLIYTHLNVVNAGREKRKRQALSRGYCRGGIRAGSFQQFT